MLVENKTANKLLSVITACTFTRTWERYKNWSGKFGGNVEQVAAEC